MPYSIHCPNCSAVNKHIRPRCEYCGSVIDREQSWIIFKNRCRPHIQALETDMENFNGLTNLLMAVIFIGGTIGAGYLTYRTNQSIGWAIAAAFIGMLPALLLVGYIVLNAENRVFERRVKGKLIAFQQENELEFGELSKLIEEICGEDSRLADQLPKLL